TAESKQALNVLIAVALRSCQNGLAIAHAPLCKPGLRPVLPATIVKLLDPPQIVLAGCAGEGERYGSKSHVKQTPALRTCHVIFTLGHGGCDDFDLAFIEPNAFIEFARSRFARRTVGQADLRRARLLEDIDDPGSLRI